MHVFFQKLYVRIWLAVVLAVAVLTLLVGWAWRMTAEPPMREVVVRSSSGEVIGNGHMRLGRRADADAVPQPGPHAATSDPSAGDSEPDTTGRFGRGPEFLVQMHDGQTVHMHLPRPPGTPWRAPFGFFWTLGLVAVAVALATYPIVRRLTRRLEDLQRGVEQWGDGNLSVRVPEGGEDEIGFLSHRFNHAAQQIETLAKTRDALLASQKSLLANASHELRSPLTRIRMGLELMGGAPDPSAARDEISRNIGELDQLIGEILLASRLDAKEADLGTVEAVDLVGLAAEECAHCQAQLLTAVGSMVVPGVSKLLRRAVRNLLENARRHGAGEVTLSLFHSGRYAVIQVCDHGPGVPVALLERIFEPFYRLPGASERNGGVGLGLALVKSIAQRHGGSAKCINSNGGGACFEIHLPKT
jgi:signal transduction histidine kinase